MKSNWIYDDCMNFYKSIYACPNYAEIKSFEIFVFYFFLTNNQRYKKHVAKRLNIRGIS